MWKQILRIFGWKVDITVPHRQKCIICVAPHTSNYDFILGLSAYKSIGRKANFLMKESWFFFPLGLLFKKLGGIPVKRDKKSDMTSRIIERFHESDYINLAITPEGTRSRTNRWHSGFLYIAQGTGVPVQLGVIDYRNKKIIIRDEMQPSGDIADDMRTIRRFYSGFTDSAYKPDKFRLPDIPSGK